MSTSKAPAPLGGYAQTVSAAGLCFVSGQVPIDRYGNCPPVADITAQAEQVFANLEACLVDRGMAIADVVSLTTYLLDAADGPAVAAVRGRFFGEYRPTSTVVEVAGLLDPAWRLEVQAIAATRAPAQH